MDLQSGVTEDNALNQVAEGLRNDRESVRRIRTHYGVWMRSWG